VSLREKLTRNDGKAAAPDLFGTYGVLANPYPSSNQTSNNPHLVSAADGEIEERILSFLRDGSSQVVVVEGTQGVGKTNILNHFEVDIQDALSEIKGIYVVRYLADPEKTFDGTIRRLFQELGEKHIAAMANALAADISALDTVRGTDMRNALLALSKEPTDLELIRSFMDWLLGLRLLKVHRERLDIQFRLDTVESKTSALRDIVVVSSHLGILTGIFLLLDELEKQDGVLGPTAIVRYLSAMRAIIDALPKHLFMMLAVTPDAMRRYSAALPAFRSRLQNQITLLPLQDVSEGLKLANFYIETARNEAARLKGAVGGSSDLVSSDVIAAVFDRMQKLAERRGDTGVRQREFLHQLHILAENSIQPGDGGLPS
jgi:hypothetical protein